MVYALFALLLFGVSVLTHIFFCRVTTKPGLQARAYVLMALFFLGVYGWTAGVMPQAGFKITSGIIFILLVPVYLCFYVLTQLTSPSKNILLAIHGKGELSYTDILAGVQKEDFISTRLGDLCASGCVTQTDGRYILTSEGKKIAAVLNFMQLVLGRGVGG